MTDSTRPEVNPNDYIITRKRKKYKFAKFYNSPLCFEFDEWSHRPVDVIEIGAGTGLFSVEQAALHPAKQFVAIDVKADRLQKGAYEATERGLTNITFLRARADQVLELFEADSLETIWITFPDPFPKKRSAGRRLTHRGYLTKYAQLLQPDNGRLCFKTDARELFLWSLEELVATGWRVNELSFDLHESGLSEVYKIMTTYEHRWTSEGIPTNFVQAMPPRQ